MTAQNNREEIDLWAVRLRKRRLFLFPETESPVERVSLSDCCLPVSDNNWKKKKENKEEREMIQEIQLYMETASSPTIYHRQVVPFGLPILATSTLRCRIYHHLVLHNIIHDTLSLSLKTQYPSFVERIPSLLFTEKTQPNLCSLGARDWALRKKQRKKDSDFSIAASMRDPNSGISVLICLSSDVSLLFF